MANGIFHFLWAHKCFWGDQHGLSRISHWVSQTHCSSFFSFGPRERHGRFSWNVVSTIFEIIFLSSSSPRRGCPRLSNFAWAPNSQNYYLSGRKYLKINLLGQNYFNDFSVISFNDCLGTSRNLKKTLKT